ncbi:MAG TPA: hypothetical protein VK766_05155 [Cytophagaceae bacterium]|nr:hypothetical protein [Cytophagaceae bacterium]
MLKNCILLSIIVLVTLLNSCTNNTADKPVKVVDSLQVDTLKKKLPPDTIVTNKAVVKMYMLTKDDISILELLQKIEMGFSFNEVKAKYPSVKGIRPEEKKDDLAIAGLTESVCKQSLFGGEAIAEFNFNNDSLYSFFFTYSEKNTDKSEQVFNAIKTYYSNRLGEAQPERVEEENHYSQNFVWPSQKSVTPYLYYNLNTNTISWGKHYERAL